MDWTSLLLGGAGLLALTTLVESNDDDDDDDDDTPAEPKHEPEPTPEPEPEPEPKGTLTNGLGGEFSFGDNGDKIVAKGQSRARPSKAQVTMWRSVGMAT